MNFEWVELTGFATVIFAGLSVLGKPQSRTAMRVGAVSSGLLLAGFLAGPPIDQYAGAIGLAVLLSIALVLFITQ
jgi:hypothetical protein